MPRSMPRRVRVTSASRLPSTPAAYSSAPLAHLGRLVLRLGDDPAALVLGGLGQAALPDEVRGLLLGARDDPLGLLLGLLDDPLALLVDPLGGTDLLGHGDTQLVDEVEGGVTVDDRVLGHRQVLAVRDQRLEALDEKDDVQRTASPGLDAPAGRCVRLWHAPGADRPLATVARQRPRAARRRPARRQHRRHVAPEQGDLLDQAGADVAVLEAGHEEHGVHVRRELVVVVGELQLGLEVRDRTQAADQERRRRPRGRSRR